MITGNELRDARVLAHLTQTELADALGTTVRSVSAWENSHVPRNKEALVRGHLGLPDAELAPTTKRDGETVSLRADREMDGGDRVWLEFVYQAPAGSHVDLGRARRAVLAITEQIFASWPHDEEGDSDAGTTEAQKRAEVAAMMADAFTDPADTLPLGDQAPSPEPDPRSPAEDRPER